MGNEATSTNRDVARLIRDHQAGVWRYLRVLGCDASEAEDLTQETFLAVLQRPFEDINPRATSAYLRKAARNLLISARRNSARYTVTANLDALDFAWEKWAGNDEGEALVAALKACLQTLTERAQQALRLRFQDRQSRREIAADLQMTEGGAKNLMQRAKGRLRSCIERKMK